MERELIVEDTLIKWLERDLRYGRFPKELSREWIFDPEGNDELVIRLRYDDKSFIDFPYSSEIYDSAWKFFNYHWQSGKLILSGGLINNQSLSRK